MSRSVIGHPLAAAGVAWALACAVAMPARAQALNPLPVRTIQSVRTVGLYADSSQSFTVTDRDGAMQVSVTLDLSKPTQRTVTAPLKAYVDGALEATFERDGKSQRVAFRPVYAEGRVLQLAVKPISGYPIVPSGTLYRRGLPASTAALVRYAGVWNVSGGTITLRVQGDRLEGEYARSLPGGFSEPIFHYTFSPSITDATGRLLGAWGEAANELGGEASLELSPDGNALYLRSVRTGVERSELLKRSSTAGTGGATGVRVVAGSATPKPGYLACNAWCEYKVVSYETQVRNYFGQGRSPLAVLRLRVHNATGQTHTFRGSGDTVQASNEALRVTWVRTGAGAGVNTINAYGPVPNPDVPDAAGIQDYMPIREVEMPGGSEIEIAYISYQLPSGADTLRFALYGKTRDLPAKEWTCSFHRRLAEIVEAGDYGLWTADATPPAFCDAAAANDPSWATAAAPGGAADGPAGAGTTGDAAVADNASGAVDGAPVAGGSLALPKPTQSAATPDGFAKLGKYGVKVESTEVRADGRYQLVAVLKNLSSAPLYLTSGQLMVYAEDSDGVGQQTGQVWRASGETPALFAATPVIQPGATLRARWLFRADPAAPIHKVSFTEGTKKVEFAE